ncbi:MAG TPA: T9SS type A sorting domain-containing protein, partial [Chitinophagaceae bacterium]|nr:T9SS type A sorting domain-containing protein [Chitinophagaceae bacterium]
SSSAISNYNANDNVAGLNGIIYYRLKIVENDGTIKYSNVINFKLSQSTRTVVSLYPNPAVNNFTVKITSPKDETVQVRVFDMLGKVLLSQQSTIVVGINNLSFNNISKLSTGTYTVQIIMSNQVFTEKLVVTK